MYVCVFCNIVMCTYVCTYSTTLMQHCTRMTFVLDSTGVIEQSTFVIRIGNRMHLRAIKE